MPIQIMKIFRESFQDVREHKAEWLRVATAPIILWLIGLIILVGAYLSPAGLTWIYSNIDNVSQGTQNFIQKPVILSLADTFYHVINIIAILSILINGYRYAFFREGGDKVWTLNLNWRFVKLVLYYILIIILTILYILIAAGICVGAYILSGSAALTAILGILFFVFGIYLGTRIGLTLFLIAIDRTIPMRVSWRLLKGNVLRVIGLVLLISLTILLISILGSIVMGLLGLLLYFISPWLLTIPAFLFILFGVAIWLLAWAAGSKAFALVYKTFTEGELI